MSESNKDGCKEGAIFLFYEDESILIEHRPSGVTFIPNGTTEEKDKTSGQYDEYTLATLHREVDEEFHGNVSVEDVQKLCECKVGDPPLWFHSYVVTDWTGEVPPFTVEDGDRYAEFEWIPLSDYEDHLNLESALKTCEALVEAKEKNQL